jgi:hypothetical protein
VKVKNSDNNSRLYYFLFMKEKQILEWTYPKPRTAGGHHSFYIIEDIKDLSSWREEFDLHEPSITMDDSNFWNEYVFKKEMEDIYTCVKLSIRIFKKVFTLAFKRLKSHPNY